MNIIPVILAGGIGERFWPFSRSSMPKQLLPIISNKSMIAETFSRVHPFCKKGVQPLVVTGKAIASKIKKALPAKSSYDCIVEPMGKNTAPAVAAAAAFCKKKYGEDSVMVVLSADHAISPKEDFVKAVKYAVELAHGQDHLVVFGIHPSRPDTGYGYIQLAKKVGASEKNEGFLVKRFVEKPDQKTAKKYVSSKKYLWNSGMFVWKTSVILAEFKQYMPSLHKQITKAEKAGLNQKALDTFYTKCIKESIDYGIMEQSQRVMAVKGAFQWDDIGSWEAISRVLPQNKRGSTVSGKRVFEADCSNTIVANNSNLTVATIGLKDAVVVTVDDAVLVIARDKLPAFKEYLKELKIQPKIPKSLF